jgi:hypothetical protein
MHVTRHTSHVACHTSPLADINFYPPGSCFKRVIVGHSTAFSVSYFLPLRGSILRRFRDQYAASFGLTHVYPKAASDYPLNQQSQPHLQQPKQSHVINLYCKTQGLTGAAWQHLCEYAGIISRAIPGPRPHLITPTHSFQHFCRCHCALY